MEEHSCSRGVQTAETQCNYICENISKLSLFCTVCGSFYSGLRMRFVPILSKTALYQTDLIFYFFLVCWFQTMIIFTANIHFNIQLKVQGAAHITIDLGFFVIQK